jgi:hypothetical protein
VGGGAIMNDEAISDDDGVRIFYKSSRPLYNTRGSKSQDLICLENAKHDTNLYTYRLPLVNVLS